MFTQKHNIGDTLTGKKRPTASSCDKIQLKNFQEIKCVFQSSEKSLFTIWTESLDKNKHVEGKPENSLFKKSYL